MKQPTVIKSFQWNDLSSFVKEDAKKVAMKLGFSEVAAMTTLWYQTDVRGKVYGISENQIALTWSESRYHKNPIV